MLPAIRTSCALLTNCQKACDNNEPYRISRAETISAGGSGSKSGRCATYFNEFFVADL